MDELLQLQDSLGIGTEPLNILTTLFNLIFCLIMSFIVRMFYINFSFSLTGKLHIGSIIPILSAVVFLVIVIVKSSLALSLGLVGALSIVRFRTPIKEPEELVYLFLSISIGLGYGAGFTLITTMIVSIILVVIYFFLVSKGSNKGNEYTIVIDWESKNKFMFSDIISIISSYSNSVKLIRLDSGKSTQTAVLLIDPASETNFDELIKNLKDKEETINVSFFESKTNW